jgi:hypothetical protein
MQGDGVNVCDVDALHFYFRQNHQIAVVLTKSIFTGGNGEL